MIEFIPGRRYFFHTATGQYVGTFLGKGKLGLKFEYVSRLVEVSLKVEEVFEADKFIDAEPWMQSVKLYSSIEAVNVRCHGVIAKSLKARKAVVIERATPGKDW